MPWKPSITKVQWKSAKIHNSNLYEDFFCEKCSFCLIMMSSSWLLKIDLNLINEFDDWRCFECQNLRVNRTLPSAIHNSVGIGTNSFKETSSTKACRDKHKLFQSGFEIIYFTNKGSSSETVCNLGLPMQKKSPIFQTTVWLHNQIRPNKPSLMAFQRSLHKYSNDSDN